jgi:uncharacterized protein
MRCPIDDTELLMNERSGVEIDYCPKCRGIWLDRGELDKIIERSGAADSRGFSAPQHFQEDRSRYDEHSHGHDHGSRSHKKKEGFLGDLFDF